MTNWAYWAYTSPGLAIGTFRRTGGMVCLETDLGFFFCLQVLEFLEIMLLPAILATLLVTIHLISSPSGFCK